MINRVINYAIIKKRRDVGAETAAPFGLGCFRISRLGALDHAHVERRVERCAVGLHDQHVVTVYAEVIAPTLVQQTNFAIAGADADP